MDTNKVTVIANNTSEGMSVIDIDIFVGSRNMHIQATRRFIDEINKVPFLNEEKIKSAITRKYGISKDNISFR